MAGYIFWGDELHWRVGHEVVGSDGRAGYTDFGRQGDALWKLTPQWLVLLDATKPIPEGHPVWQSLRQSADTSLLLVHGGLHLVKTATVRSCEVVADSWTIECGPTADGRNVVVRGRWDEAAKLGFIEAIEFLDGSSSILFESWDYREEIHRWVCSDLTVSNSADHSRLNVRLTDARVLDETELFRSDAQVGR